jgi:6-phosphogluconolactonase/glucosamine-6-phosphate isomerase/deaminase
MNYIYTDDPIEDSAKAVSESILKQLSAGKRVLWLLSGGSGAAVVTRASQLLRKHDLSNLSATMTDERYGPVGHKDENWQGLLGSGFELPGANLYRTLIGEDRSKTVSALEKWLDTQIKNSDYIVGIFGIGEDGHTAGIKPNSPAVSSPDLVTSFIGDDFERITVTFNMIKKVNEAVIQASGAGKKGIISNLLQGMVPLNQQPAQILKIIPHTTFYSDNKGEDL